ncbi:hypothetical protein B4O97_10455 [Marispirochaeta aestuarii]|uniref:Uncharacterized protein n=1 Tax=Marispirochaeta aestuarii TaxID=1963862 RepID=A0A1Y1RXT1_9SPIO|nr:hypothetical protein [Marispirochaeta aestuarii]ORC35143.1 hypothetical protein B4O97_10455 [Marispirochaeta aestuarii]
MNEYFNIRRFLLLTKREEFMRLHSLVFSALAIAGSVAVLLLLTGFRGGGTEYMNTLFLMFLFAGGALTAAGTFRNMHSRDTCHDWLMLPASTEEKFFSRLLAASAGWWLYINLVFFVGVLVGEILRFLVIGEFRAFFNPLSPVLLRAVHHYIILQSLFFAGGAWFRRHQFLKSVLFLSLLGISLGLFSLIAARIIFGSYFHEAFSFDMSIHVGDRFFGNTLETGELILRIVKTLYLWLTAPFCWLITYLRVREAEVKNAL